MPSLIIILMILSFYLPVSAIYNFDDRAEVNQSGLTYGKPWPKNIVSLVENKFLTIIPGGAKANCPSLQKSLNLCPVESFIEQPSLSYCTGFILNNDWIVTAGHCVDKLSCSTTSLILNYTKEKDPEYIFTNDELLKCLDVRKSDTADVAFIKYQSSIQNKTVSSREQDYFRFLAGPPTTNLFIMGFPSGLPMKVSRGKLVSSSDDLIVAKINAFHGNSGSPVLNSDGQIVGMLLKGNRDYYYDLEVSCNFLYYCTSNKNCEGESLLPYSIIIEEFDKLQKD